MTKEQIDAIFERARAWPIDSLTEEDWADLEEALAEAEREEPVPDEEIKALFDRYRSP